MDENIFHYPDMVLTIAKNLDFLIQQDRVAFDGMINLMPEIQDLNADDSHDMRLQAFNDWTWYNSTIYTSKVLENRTTPHPYPLTFTYILSAIWDKNLPKPTVNLNQLANVLALNLYPDKNLHSILSHGYIWSLTGPAGLIFQDNRLICRIFCNDKYSYRLNFLKNSDTPEEYVYVEYWYTNGKLHRENGPAYTFYSAKDKPLIQNWFTDGNIYKHLKSE